MAFSVAYTLSSSREFGAAITWWGARGGQRGALGCAKGRSAVGQHRGTVNKEVPSTLYAPGRRLAAPLGARRGRGGGEKKVRRGWYGQVKTPRGLSTDYRLQVRLYST
eukprot:107398-Prorocentrum_minimum.AAC.2